MLDTPSHGALKNYQWVNRPLALIGRVNRRRTARAWRSTSATIRRDAVLMITGPRAARGQGLPRAEEPGRHPDRGTRSDPGARRADAACGRSRTSTTSTPDDFLSADLQIVPAQMPVDIGLDHQFVGAYGHDDRSNGFAAFRAIVEVKTPQKTAIAYGVNNEEVGFLDDGRRVGVVPHAGGRNHRGAGGTVQRPDAAPRAPGVAGARVGLHDGARPRLPAAVTRRTVRRGSAGAWCSRTTVRGERPTREYFAQVRRMLHRRRRALADARLQGRLRRRHDRAVVRQRQHRHDRRRVSASSACTRRWTCRRRSTSGNSIAGSRHSGAPPARQGGVASDR